MDALQRAGWLEPNRSPFRVVYRGYVPVLLDARIIDFASQATKV